MTNQAQAVAIAHAVTADLILQYLAQTEATPTPADAVDRLVAVELRALQQRHAHAGRAVFAAVAHPVRLTLITDATGEPLTR